MPMPKMGFVQVFFVLSVKKMRVFAAKIGECGLFSAFNGLGECAYFGYELGEAVAPV